MKTQEIARHLLNRQNAGPLVFPGEIVAAIGSDAMQEALSRRWLIPEQDSGLLSINTNAAMVEDMRSIAQECPECHKADCVCAAAVPANESHGMAYGHALRRGGVNSLDELLAPATGHDSNSPMLKTPVPPTPATPPRPAASVAGGKPIGVATKTPQGKINLELNKDTDAQKVAQELQTQ